MPFGLPERPIQSRRQPSANNQLYLSFTAKRLVGRSAIGASRRGLVGLMEAINAYLQ